MGRDREKDTVQEEDSLEETETDMVLGNQKAKIHPQENRHGATDPGTVIHT